MNDKRQLLCTFSSTSSFQKTIEEIKKFYSVNNNKFFVFINTINPKEVFITYNILCDVREFPKFQNTISIHIKKKTNTIYTLNAMNQIIRDENGGLFDKKFSVNWIMYKDSLIITGTPSIRVIPIKILEIVN